MNQKTDEERRALVEEWRASGETMARFSRMKGISRESLMRWNRKPGVGVESSFLPVAVVGGRSNLPYDEEPCRILVGDLFVVECRERSSVVGIEKALRAAVTACGLNSAR